MSPRKGHRRLLDGAVVLVSAACVAAPFLPAVNAASGPGPSLVESGGTVDQRVLSTGMISSPIGLTFPNGNSGKLDGRVHWDTYTTARTGMKLVIASDRKPAMRDAANGVDVPDAASRVGTWSVTSGGRTFGFGVTGAMALPVYGGDVWRGFEGTRSIEVARKTSPLPITRTTVLLRAQLDTPLASNARLTARINGTGVPNL